jgi:ATP-dependent Lhr-like helicase
VAPADFMRFLFDWQHVADGSRLTGIDGLRAVLTVLDGFELQASAWERSILPARMERYDPSLLDALCLTGEVGWGRLSPGRLTTPVPASPIAIFLREHADDWRALRALSDSAVDGDESAPHDEDIDPQAREILDRLRRGGASFFRDLRQGSRLSEQDLRSAIGRLVGGGHITSDGFAGLRAIVRAKSSAMAAAGRWSVVERQDDTADRNDTALETYAWSLLKRYGVVFRRLLTRESSPPPWRLLTRIYRQLEARGEIRGGRFVAGMSGEQFALPGAVERLREIRRTPPDGRVVVISAADPLNLAGVLDVGERVRAVSGNRLAYRNGVALAAMEGDFIREITACEPEAAASVATALAGRQVPPIRHGYVGR